MTARSIREQLGALLAGLSHRATQLQLPRPTLTWVEVCLLLLVLIILGLAGAADQATP